MKVLATLLISLGLLTACGPMTDAQKDAKKFQEFCAKADNKVKVPECAGVSGGPN